jgi:hypothetical protein
MKYLVQTRYCRWLGELTPWTDAWKCATRAEAEQVIQFLVHHLRRYYGEARIVETGHLSQRGKLPAGMLTPGGQRAAPLLAAFR